ncbi:hypothetical protein JMS36_001785 [Salmonella enterica]|nr:hypothetical protein [Salmonella enterica]
MKILKQTGSVVCAMAGMVLAGPIFATPTVTWKDTLTVPIDFTVVDPAAPITARFEAAPNLTASGSGGQTVGYIQFGRGGADVSALGGAAYCLVDASVTVSNGSKDITLNFYEDAAGERKIEMDVSGAIESVHYLPDMESVLKQCSVVSRLKVKNAGADFPPGKFTGDLSVMVYMP